MEQLAASPLVLDERQRAEQVRAILHRALVDALSGPWRARLERRLLDTAYLIARRAKSDHDRARDHLADAALCLAAAAEVADAARPPEQVTVARALFDRLISQGPAGDAPSARSPAGLIVTP
jgi:hypothetical protein